MGQEQCDKGDHNGCDRDPVPGTMLTEGLHSCCAEYSKGQERMRRGDKGTREQDDEGTR
jgi:hypothetical protein